jgi:hypothetical protein
MNGAALIPLQGRLMCRVVERDECGRDLSEILAQNWIVSLRISVWSCRRDRPTCLTQQDARFITLPRNALLVGFTPQSVSLDDDFGRVRCNGDTLKEAVEMLANIRITG